MVMYIFNRLLKLFSCKCIISIANIYCCLGCCFPIIM